MALTASYNMGIAGSWWHLNGVSCENGDFRIIVADAPLYGQLIPAHIFHEVIQASKIMMLMYISI